MIKRNKYEKEKKKKKNAKSERREKLKGNVIQSENAIEHREVTNDNHFFRYIRSVA